MESGIFCSQYMEQQCCAQTLFVVHPKKNREYANAFLPLGNVTESVSAWSESSALISSRECGRLMKFAENEDACTKRDSKKQC